MKINEYLITIAIAFSANIILFILLYKPDVKLYPNNSVSKILYSDQTRSNGTSQIDTNYIDKNLQISYKLTSIHPWPFVGLRLEPKSPIDLRKYDEILLNLSIGSELKAIVAFWTDPSEFGDSTTEEQPYHYSLKLYPTESSYTIPISECVTPQWWFENEQFEHKDIPSDNLKNVNAIGIRSGYAPAVNKNEQFTLQSITLKKQNHFLYLLLTGIFIISLLITFIKIRLQKQLQKRLIIPVKDLNIISKNSNLAIVMQVIGENCDNSEMNLYMVAEKSNLSETEVSRLIKSEFNLNFKQYLNRARMEITTKLLKDSNLSIKEIIFKSGYKNKSHFFRVFKMFYDQSPSEYRENLNKNNHHN